MDNELDIDVVMPEEEEEEAEVEWIPEDNAQALRWKCIKLASSLTTVDKVAATAANFEEYITTGKKTKLSVVK